MVRAFSMAVVLVAAAAATSDAQIVSNPVVTSWSMGTNLTTYPLPTAPMAANVCAPPVVTFGEPIVVQRVMTFPTTSCCTPNVVVTPVPVVVHRFPTMTVQRPVVLRGFAAPPVQVYRPIMVSPLPVTTMFAPPMSATPVTSFFAPSAASAISTPVQWAPVPTGRSCNCQGG